MQINGRTRALIALAAIVFVTLSGAPSASSHPLRGHVPFSVILCKFSNRPAENPTTQTVRDYLLNESASADAVAAYWRTVSYGLIDLGGSTVVGWYPMPITFEQWPDRGSMIQTCVDAAKNHPTNPYVVPAGNRTVAIVNDCRDSGAAGGRVLLDPCAVYTSWGAHETGHALGFGHSFSNDLNYRNASWSAPGEYDDESDLMSCMNCWGRTTAQFSPSPPGLNAPHLDRMGWIARPRAFRFGANGAASSTITLRALSNTAGTGYRIARVPFDPADLFHYYTVELRAPSGLDAGTGAMRVVIHEVKNGVSILIRSGRTQVEDYTDAANQVTIRVLSKDPATETAVVRIDGAIAGRCLQGYVWREARPSDRVCVTPARRTETRSENALAAGRRNPGGGAFGPDTCRSGFVWREAFAGDHVCVPPATRALVRSENSSAPTRVNPARLVYGPNACKQGFVWREADASDYVCVVPQTRSETRAENALASARKQPGGGAFGSDTCRFGFVWREAFPSDHVCVPVSSRTRAAADNAAAASRVQRP